MPKSPDAFRTISEVADWLGIQAHVLRFWESKFSQVKPIKRAGGRRYYRPNDMLLLGGIRQLLHEDGLTIKGVQKILREEGVAHVAGLSTPLDELTQSQVDDTKVAEAPMVEAAEPETAVVLNFESPAAKEEEAAPELPFEVEQPTAEPEVIEAAPEPLETTPEEEVAAEAAPATEIAPEEVPEAMTDLRTEQASEQETQAQDEVTPSEATATLPETDEIVPEVEPDIEEAPQSEETPAVAALPAFLQRPMADAPETTDNAPAEPPVVEEAAVVEDPSIDEEPPSPKPRIIEMPLITPHDQIEASPALLTSAIRAKHLSIDQARQIAPLLDRLTILRDSMAARRRNAGQSSPDA